MHVIRVFLCVLLSVLLGQYILYAQTPHVRPANVHFYFDEQIGSLVVTYDLAFSSPLETYEIQLSFVDGRNFVIYPNSIRGDTGYVTDEGGKKKIVWEIFNDIDELPPTARPRIIIVSINQQPVDPSMALILSQINLISQPGYTFSMKRDGLMILGVGAGISSLLFNLKAGDYIDQQNLAVSLDEYHRAGENANSYYNASYMGGALAAVSVGISLYQYIRIRKERKSPYALNLTPLSNKGMALTWRTSF